MLESSVHHDVNATLIKPGNKNISPSNGNKMSHINKKKYLYIYEDVSFNFYENIWKIEKLSTDFLSTLVLHVCQVWIFFQYNTLSFSPAETTGQINTMSFIDM